MWHSGYQRWLSSHRSPVRTRPVAVLPPTGLARPGTGATPAFASFNHTTVFPWRAAIEHGCTATQEKKENETSHLQQCAPPGPSHDGRLPPHPFLAFARAAAPAARTTGFQHGTSGAGVQGASTEASGATPLLGRTNHTAGSTNKQTSAWRRDARPCPTIPHRASLGRHP